MSPLAIRTRTIIFLLLVGSLLPHAAGAQTTAAPVLLRASAITPTSTLLVVTGHGFTPGGLVYLAVYDQWGVETHAHVWTIASLVVFGPNGSADPAMGHMAAGTVEEAIDLFPATVFGPNGSQDPALGYRPGVDAGQASVALYGPDGSQDPALGYVPAENRQSGGVICGRSLMVRAYDAGASVWSDVIDATTSC